MELLVSRLEVVTAKLEQIALNKHSSETFSSPCSAAMLPYVEAFDDISKNFVIKFIQLSDKIGGDVAEQAQLVKSAFAAQHEFLVLAASCKQPSQDALPSYFKKTAEKICAIQDFKDKHRTSKFLNHLSAIAESIPALGWISVSPTPAPYIKEMTDAGQFYTNRILKEFKEKDATHVDWVKAWLQVLGELQSYVKQHHTTGVSWNKQGGDPSSFKQGSAVAPPPPGPPPPPAPLMAASLPSHTDDSSDDVRAQLFSDLNKGEDITKSLKKVSDDMKTHKNPALRFNTPLPFKAGSKPGTGGKPEIAHKPGSGAKPEVKKAPKLELEGKKWIVEFHSNNQNIVISDTELKQTVYIYKCDNCTVTIKGKVNAITMDNCKKTGLVFDESISSLDFVNCQSVKAQVLGKVPIINIDKTDGCMVFLSKDSTSAQIVSAKSSEMNILLPDAQNEFREFPVPEQFKTYWDGSKLVTECTDIQVG